MGSQRLQINSSGLEQIHHTDPGRCIVYPVPSKAQAAMLHIEVISNRQANEWLLGRTGSNRVANPYESPTEL